MCLETKEKNLENACDCWNLGTNPINIFHPRIECFNITHCNISAEVYSFYTEAPFGNYIGYIGVYYSTVVGNYTTEFGTAVGTNYGNNVGFP